MISSSKKYFVLHASNIVVKGSKRAIISDLNKGRYKFIPLILADILKLNRIKSIEEIKKIYDHQYNEGIDAYFDCLSVDDWGMFTEEPNLFPEINLQWHSSLQITNFICDFNEKSDYNISNILLQLDEIGCEAVQFRFFCPLKIDKLNLIDQAIIDSSISFLEIIGGWNEQIEEIFYVEFLKRNERIRRIVIHSSPKDEIIETDNFPYCQKIIHTSQSITSHQFCGIIDEAFFAVNLSSFTESLRYNSCLNRKLSIDVDGNIKNCPSMKQSFGNIKQVSIKDIADLNEIRQLWEINKDQVSVCKDCEFRYICTDCRAYLEEENNVYSKPLKCNYDPYTTTWL